jgi:hypothetical protein
MVAVRTILFMTVPSQIRNIQPAFVLARIKQDHDRAAE